MITLTQRCHAPTGSCEAMMGDFLPCLSVMNPINESLLIAKSSMAYH
ncbi:hypothetical protein [Flagellimonas aurea]